MSERGAPAVLIVLPLEGAPRVVWDCPHIADARLEDWLRENQDCAELVAQALDLAKAKAA